MSSSAPASWSIQLVVAVGTHHTKKPLFSHDDRLALLTATLEPIGKRTDTEFKIVEFAGLMVKAARQHGAKLIIRGLRDTTDYNYEMQMVGMNAQMAPDLQTVFLPSQPARPAHLGHTRAPDRRNGRRHLRLRSRQSFSRPQESMNSPFKRAGAILGILASLPPPCSAPRSPRPSASIAQAGTPH